MTSRNGLTIALPRFAGVGLQFHLHAFVQPDAIFQLQPLDLPPPTCPAGLKFLRVTTAGSLTKPSAIALPSG